MYIKDPFELMKDRIDRLAGDYRGRVHAVWQEGRL